MTEAKTTPTAPPDGARAESTPADRDDAAAVLQDLADLRARARERDEYLSLLQRTRADFENYQKRVKRDADQERLYAHQAFAKDLLPVLDNLERATAAAQQAGETGPLVQGVALVRSQLLDLLKRHGITPIEAQGQPFDPNLHQGMMQQANPNVPPNTVVQVLEQGFKIHDRVLRPAKVVLSA